MYMVDTTSTHRGGRGYQYITVSGKDRVAKMSQPIPGTNHNYQVDVPFYTLQSNDGTFLSHPQSFSFSSLWPCAWVVYSIADLRKLYKAVSNKAKKTVLIPCTGTMVSGPCGITCPSIKQLSPKDVKAIEKQETRQSVGDWSQAPKRLRKRQKTSIQGTLNKLSRNMSAPTPRSVSRQREESLL